MTSQMSIDKFVIGCEEWCALPDLGLSAIKIKVDSGANTSALHAFNISTYNEGGNEYVRFDVHPIQGNRKIVKSCTAQLLDRRVVKSSNGLLEQRYVILSSIRLGVHVWDIEISLTNRDSMGYRMLLGREAMRNKVLVDPDLSFLVSKMGEREAIKNYTKYIDKKTALNLVLLASNPDLYSNRRIMEAAEARGHNIFFANVNNCYINIKSGVPSVYYKGDNQLKEIDAVIPRLKPSVTFYGCALIRQFQALGAFCLNDSNSISNSRDKLKCLQILSDKGIDMPITSFASSPEDTNHLISAVGGAPLVIKLLEGAQGRGVILADSNKAATSVINAFKTLKAKILVQEFIAEANCCDIRCFVVDNKVVAAMQRKAANGEFRSNLHLGGSANPVKLSLAESKIAVNCARSLGLKVAGVDILRSKNGSKVIEVNSSPGLEGIEQVVKLDVAGFMIECIEKHIYG
jgi:ribosomal protein S6--L-glutamate ligase